MEMCAHKKGFGSFIFNVKKFYFLIFVKVNFINVIVKTVNMRNIIIICKSER